MLVLESLVFVSPRTVYVLLGRWFTFIYYRAIGDIIMDYHKFKSNS